MKFLNKAKKLIDRIDTPAWLEILLGVVILLRIPSFFEPYNYGDEMIYLTLGQGMRHGIPLYLGLHDNKPPLLYITAALAGNLFWFKVLLATFNLTAIYLFWKITSNLVSKNKSFQKVSTILFAVFTTIPTLEGNIANAENFMAVPTLLAFLWILTKKHNFKNLFSTGILFSLAALFKIVGAFDILAVVFFWLIYIKKKSFTDFLKKVTFLSLGFLTPLGLTFVWYFYKGALNEYVVAAFLQNVGYVSSWRPSDVQKPFLIKNAPLIIRATVLFAGFGVLWVAKKKLSKPFVLTSAWLLATLFAVTLSERPYPHYLLQAVPPTAILLGFLFTFKNVEQTLSVIPLTLAFFVPFYFKFWHYPVLPYYTRFTKFATGKINKSTYLNSFSSTTNRNYELAGFLSVSSRPQDYVFVWSSDSSTIYALSRRLPPTRYVADYHFLDFSTKEETLNTLQKTDPKFIVLTDNSPEFTELRTLVHKSYYKIYEVNSAEVWMKLEI